MRAKDERHWQWEKGTSYSTHFSHLSTNREKDFKFVNCLWSEQILLKMCIEIHAGWRVRNLTL